MSHHKRSMFGILWVLVLFLPTSESFSWPFSSSGKVGSSDKPSELLEVSHNSVGEFSMESFSSKKGMKLVENAKSKIDVPNSCWQNAYRNLFAACSKILASEDQRSRLAWHLTDCFQKDSGRPAFPYCDAKAPMISCLTKLDGVAHSIYAEFYIETNSICHQLQADAFKRQMERLVNELKTSAEYTKEKLENIGKQSERLVHSSDLIHDSLSSIDKKTQQVSQTSKNIEERVSVVLQHSQTVYEQSVKIVDSQMELRDRQINMNEKLDEGMMMLNESTNKLGEEMNNLRNEAVEIEKEIGKVGDEMFMKMNVLQRKANDIENITETSLDRQKQLLESQTTALEFLHNVTSFQSQALEESRLTQQRLIDISRSHHQELMQRQEQLKQSHDRLAESSKTILAAQESFLPKQASMFSAIDKLFNLLNAILLESRVMKAFIAYSLSIFTTYILTGTKRTSSVRLRLYFGLCMTFFIEYMVLRYGNDIEQQTWIISSVRLIFLVLASCQLFYTGYTYRDYETLNHRMLQSLVEKINRMQHNKQGLYDDDIDVNWYKFIDSDLPEDDLNDLDYMVPEEALATTSVSQKYGLRHRRL